MYLNEIRSLAITEARLFIFLSINKALLLYVKITTTSNFTCMKKNIFISVLLLFVISISVTANTDKQTYTYSIKQNDTLQLDVYNNIDIEGRKPCIIYMFGGGFMGGSRGGELQETYFKNLTDFGYIVVSIDYRLGLKDVPNRIKNGEKIGLKGFINLLDSAVTIAVEDLFDATNFVLENAEDWNIDKNLIVANGSSAGGISVLQGEYAICSNSELAKKLPANFNYAGVISFAGAIFTTKGSLKWYKMPAPIQFFHGNADSTVPYDKIKLFKIGFYGSKHISDQLKEKRFPYYFYDVDNAAHEISGTPMIENLNEIKIFMDKFVIQRQQLMIHTQAKQIGKIELRKNLGIMDYIKANFGGN